MKIAQYRLRNLKFIRFKQLFNWKYMKPWFYGNKVEQPLKMNSVHPLKWQKNKRYSLKITLWKYLWIILRMPETGTCRRITALWKNFTGQKTIITVLSSHSYARAIDKNESMILQQVKVESLGGLEGVRGGGHDTAR